MKSIHIPDWIVLGLNWVMLIIGLLCIAVSFYNGCIRLSTP